MKKTITLFAALLCAYLSQAQAIKYHDVNPDTTISTWEVFGVGGIDIWWHPSPEVVVNTMLGTAQLLCNNDTLPLALAKDADISASATGKWLTTNYACLNCGGVIGNWKGATDKYIAMRDKDGSGNWKYGWIRLSIPANATSFTIKDYAMHNTANTAIKAGQAVGTGIAQYTPGDNSIQLSLERRMVSVTGTGGPATLTITDISGRCLLQQRLTANEQVDVSAYPAGVYLFVVKTGSTGRVFKMAME